MTLTDEVGASEDQGSMDLIGGPSPTGTWCNVEATQVVSKTVDRTGSSYSPAQPVQGTANIFWGTHWKEIHNLLLSNFTAG